MNVSAVLGGVFATGLVAGLIGYGVVLRDTGAMMWSTDGGDAPETAELAEQATAVASEPVAEAAPRPMPTAQSTPEMPRSPEIPLPEMGLVRVDAEGGALVAGTGPVSTDVVLRLDGVEVAATRTDRSGSFVAMFDLPVSVEPQLLTLEVQTPDGVLARAADSVIVAPSQMSVALPGNPPDADRSTFRPRAEQAVAGDVATPQAGQAPEVEAVTSAALDRTSPVDPPRPSGDETLADRTEPAAPVDVFSETTAGTTPSVGSAPIEPTPAPPATEIERAAPPPPATPARSDAPERTVPPELATDIAPVAPAPGGLAPEIAERRASLPDAPAAPRLIRSGPEGLSVIPPATAAQPEVTQELGIDVIAYDEVGDVQLAGRAQTDTELRIYLDNRPVQTVRVGPDGEWSAPLSGVDSGVYTLRIDEVDAAGDVTARVETPFQRTAPEIAAQARRDGATAITVQTGFTLWALSEGYFGDGVQYVQLFEANRDQIRDPDLIYPGQIFRLPEAE